MATINKEYYIDKIDLVGNEKYLKKVKEGLVNQYNFNNKKINIINR